MQPGTQLGHYEILEAIGKGGMGEVWRAKDTKLGRDVAIKTLPPEFAQDAERLARFEREAKLLASLNHPNIAAIYGLEEHEGSRFLVLELVEGDTLGYRIKQGPIPVEEALNLALQIADALKAAHESGVIHRDLKPDNIKVSDNGSVKVLDFGLAKAMAAEDTDVAVSNSPTLSFAATQAGVILGTAAYMSPEQAKGRAVDRRADVWAFGCVLYEMLSGRQSFGKSDATESLAAVISLQPEWETLPRNLHPRLLETVERCLEKNVVRRYQDIGDVKVDIEKVLADGDGLIVQRAVEAVQGPPQSKLPWVAAIVVAAILASVAGWMLKPERNPEPLSVRRFSLDLPASQLLAAGNDTLIGLSPDGTTLVYRALEDGRFRLYRRLLDQFQATEIPGTEDAFDQPFFSPDGEWLGFRIDEALMRVGLGGGQPIRIGSLAINRRGVAWGSDGTIVASQLNQGLASLAASGGEPVNIATPEDSQEYWYPQILPGGRTVLFTASAPAPDSGDLMILDLLTNETRVVMEAGVAGRYVPTGHLVFIRQGDLWAVPFDLERMEVFGTPGVVEQGIRVEGGGAVQFAVADDGTLAYIPGETFGGGGYRQLVWVDREGNEEVIGADSATYLDPALSPDGTNLAVTVVGRADGNEDIWIWDFARGSMSRLTSAQGRDRSALWESDESVLFASLGTEAGVYRKASDGTGEAERVVPLTNGGELWPVSQSTDGQVLYTELPDVDIVMAGPGVELGPLIETEFLEAGPVVSPDGRWVAFHSNRTGEFEVYVRPFPDVEGGEWSVSVDGGTNPVWSRDGTELFFDDGQGLMVVDVEIEPDFSVGVPRRLFEGVYIYGLSRQWDVSPDGRRFLMIRNVTATGDVGAEPLPFNRINIVLNWFSELRERVPVN